MNNKKHTITAIFAACCLFVLIIDTKTAIAGGREGIEQCITVIIPSLFPFFLLGGMFCQAVGQLNLSCLSPVRRFCKMPKGSEPLLLVGMLGGYPVGAREVSAAYHSGVISRSDGQRLLGFCNNAGPAFIFGIIAMQFDDKTIGLWIFLIQILSAIFTAAILPGGNKNTIAPSSNKIDTLSIFQNSLRSICFVCGWVILFRILLSFLDRWIFWSFPEHISVILTGVLELANGSTRLTDISNDGLRMIVSSAILSLGGICVYLQTFSVTRGLGMGMYFPGKLIQCCFSIILSGMIQRFLFDPENSVPTSFLFLPLTILLFTYLVGISTKAKKRVAITQ